jgi:hypothetical protein
MPSDRRSRSTSPRHRRPVACVALFVLLAATPGCRLLADELTWLDRSGPAVENAPERPVTGLAPGA